MDQLHAMANESDNAKTLKCPTCRAPIAWTVPPLTFPRRSRNDDDDPNNSEMYSSAYFTPVDYDREETSTSVDYIRPILTRSDESYIFDHASSPRGGSMSNGNLSDAHSTIYRNPSPPDHDDDTATVTTTANDSDRTISDGRENDNPVTVDEVIDAVSDAASEASSPHWTRDSSDAQAMDERQALAQRRWEIVRHERLVGQARERARLAMEIGEDPHQPPPMTLPRVTYSARSTMRFGWTLRQYANFMTNRYGRGDINERRYKAPTRQNPVGDSVRGAIIIDKVLNTLAAAYRSDVDEIRRTHPPSDDDDNDADDDKQQTRREKKIVRKKRLAAIARIDSTFGDPYMRIDSSSSEDDGVFQAMSGDSDTT